MASYVVTAWRMQEVTVEFEIDDLFVDDNGNECQSDHPEKQFDEDAMDDLATDKWNEIREEELDYWTIDAGSDIERVTSKPKLTDPSGPYHQWPTYQQTITYQESEKRDG